MSEVTWTAFLDATAGEVSGSEIARRLGVNSSTVSRWRAGTASPSAEQVIAFAREYDEDPIYALFAAGFLTLEETKSSGEPPYQMQLRDFSDLALAREIVRRVEEGESVVLDAPLGSEHPALKRERDDLLERRNARYRPLDRVAKKSRRDVDEFPGG